MENFIKNEASSANAVSVPVDNIGASDNGADLGSINDAYERIGDIDLGGSDSAPAEGKGTPEETEGTPKEADAAPENNLGKESRIILRCEQLHKSYSTVKALDGISFEIPEGKIIGLLGPNGSGKTTFIKIVAGLLTPDFGRVTVDGHDIGVESKSLVAYLPERNSIPEHFTVGDAVDFYEDFFSDFDRARAEDMLAALRVDKRLKIKSLSKGTKEKVQLVMVMARRARLYILDEPISGVDPAARDYIIDTILRNYSPTSSVIISTHLISDIEKAMDGFIFLKYGKIACIGTPEGLLRSLGKTVDQYFREVFRC
ncbi:MAG: ABC transporter ATP-binding protein [Clostridia bacterium]|nr:ABC transporter ATP-binding protein [Clostridia bacterium]